jgi:endonuclease YncB( thermonuclease family)
MPRQHALAAVVIVAALASACAPRAEEISGRVGVIDGDSFRIGAAQIRLHAVDAFEGRQSCGSGGSLWACGAAASNKLRALTEGRQVTCRKTDTDTYGRTVAICSNGTLDLGAEMVRSGLALAYREYGDDYVDEENEAKAARRGAWAADFTAPWDERHGGGASPTQSGGNGAERAAPTSTCRNTGIKGNINRGGEHIYHVPGSGSYDETVIDESKGERWFCTEEAARRGGWRAPRNR